MLNKIQHKGKIIRLRQQLKTHTTAFNLLLQCLGSLALGLVMFLNDTFFMTRAKELILLYFIFIIVSQFLEIISSASIGVGKCFRSIGRFLLVSGILSFLWYNIQTMFLVIPVALSLWLMLVSVSNFITFVQYRDEKDTASFQYVFAAIGNILFAMIFIINTENPISASIRILGVYCVVLSVSVFFDFLSKAIPRRSLNRLKHGVRIAPPSVLTILLPQSLLNGLNEFFKERPERVPEGGAEPALAPLPPPETTTGINVEVFIHVSKKISGLAGHVDLAVGDTIYCYGAYDKQQSKKYGGIAGAGVIYVVEGKEEYIKFCKTNNQETMFGFGLVLTEDEYAKIQEKIVEVEERSYPWQCPSQVAAKNGDPTDVFEDFPSRLANAMDVSFYKFKKGDYKHYLIMGINCVTFVDDLLKASGMKTVLTGIFTPGTYYDFLNAEFLKGSDVVVKREVYSKASDRYFSK